MKLEEIYHRCGLKDPEEYKKELLERVLFSGDDFFQRTVMEEGRMSGKTTNFMARGIQNLFDGRSTLILSHSLGIISHHSNSFKKYASLFPELVIEQDEVGEFVATFHPTGRPKLKFVSIHNGIIQSANINRFEWDEIFDDSDLRRF